MRSATLAVLALACCGGESTAPEKVVRGSELIEDAEAKSALASLQGTFSMPWWRNGHEQHPEVWSIEGDTLTRWDGTKEETAKISIVAPCLAKVTWPSGSCTYEEFVIDGDTVWFGEEGGGTYGNRTVICTSRGTWVLDKSGICRAWELAVFSPHPSGMNPRDTTCTVTADGLFEADGKRWQQRDEAFFRTDFEKRNPKPPVKYPSLADAKAAVGRPPELRP